MTGKFLSDKDIAAAKHEQEVWNSQLKRGLIDPSKFVRIGYVVCGCGRQGCGFITRWMKNQPNVIDLQQQKELYQKWLEEHKPDKS
jgi:hypothetical protein